MSLIINTYLIRTYSFYLLDIMLGYIPQWLRTPRDNKQVNNRTIKEL
jgi:hypothetical protein